MLNGFLKLKVGIPIARKEFICFLEFAYCDLIGKN